MIKAFFTAVLYQPLYNILVLLMMVLPWADAGVIIIVFTVLIRLVLYPLSRNAIVAQLKMRELNPQLEVLKEKYKNDKQEQAKQIMAFYQKNNLNPFSGFFSIFIQLFIIITINHIFTSGSLATIDTSLLYSFVHAPDSVNMHLFGFLDLTHKNYILPVTAAIAQFVQAQLIAPVLPPSNKTEQSFANDLARSMSFQTKYVIPVFILFASYFAAPAVALYWTVSSLFAIGQELYIRRKYKTAATK